eukprot:3745858-Rhodomonas_salina.1
MLAYSHPPNLLHSSAPPYPPATPHLRYKPTHPLRHLRYKPRAYRAPRSSGTPYCSSPPSLYWSRYRLRPAFCTALRA